MKPTIIIVDDVLEIREELAVVLEKDFEILAKAVDGTAAIKAIRNHGPQLVVIDVVMPGISGIEVLREILSGPPPHPKFVMVSGVKEEKIVLEALTTGASEYLYKPVPNSLLIESLKRLIT